MERPIMKKAEAVKVLKENAGLSTLAQAEAAYDSLFGIIKATLQKGDAVSIAGFGSFKVVERKARKGRNPRTGEEIQILASRAVKFTPGKALKESV
jgi:DNA-binding protein HU-beta